MAGMLSNIIDFDPFHWLVHAMGLAAVWLVQFVFWMVREALEPNLKDAWFRGQFSLSMRVSVYLLVPLVMVATIQAIGKGSMHALVRTYLVALPVAILGGVVAISFASLLQNIDLALVDAVSKNTQSQMHKFYDALTGMVDATGKTKGGASEAAMAGAVQGPIVLQIIIFLLLILAAFVLVIELIFRQVMIYLAMMCIPMAFAGYVWTATRKWLVDSIEIAVTMIFAKFFIAGTLGFGFIMIVASTGANALDGGGGGWANMGMLISGVAVVVMACVAAPAVLTFIVAPRHDIASRKQFGQMTPMNSDRTYVRGKAMAGAKGMARKVVK